MRPGVKTVGAVSCLADAAPAHSLEIRIVGPKVGIIGLAIVSARIIQLIDGETGAYIVSPVIAVERAGGDDLAHIGGGENPVRVLLNHAVNPTTRIGKAMTVIEAASLTRDVAVIAEHHPVAVIHNLLGDTFDLRHIAGSDGVIKHSAGIVSVVGKGFAKYIDFAATAQSDIGAVIAPYRDRQRHLFEAFVGNLADTIGGGHHPEVVIYFFEPIQHQAGFPAHYRNVICPPCFFLLDKLIEYGLVLGGLILVHFFGKEVASHTSDIAHMGDVYQDGFERPRFSHLCVEVVEEGVLQIFPQLVRHRTSPLT